MAYNSTLSDAYVMEDDDRVYLCDETSNFETISGAFFILISVFSVTGNCLLVYGLLIYKPPKTQVTNLFVLNLACSDLIFAVTLPFSAVHVLHHWVFGEFVCKLMTALYLIGLYSSIFLLTAMTVDRFVTVVVHNNPSHSLRRQRFAMAACAVSWVISSAASVSDTIKVQVVDYDSIFFCEDPSDGPELKLGYYLQVSLLFFLPFAVIVVCYSAILVRVLHTSNRKRHRTVVVVLSIVAVFFICWGPYNILLFIETLYEPESCILKDRLDTAYSICRLLAFSHCCMNPLLVIHSQKSFRRNVLSLLRCKRIREKNKERGTGQYTSVVQNAVVNAQSPAEVLELRLK